MYETCHFISSRDLSGFPGDPFPADYPDYPRHDLVRRYLGEYADRHRIRPRFTFGTEVVSARLEAGGVAVELAPGGSRHYSSLVVAVGNEWRPTVPDVPGTFAGELIHSSAYRSPDLLRGRRVLVVGGGNSGCDVAVDAATHAAHAAISLRRGYHFIPKHILGRPADVFAHMGPPLPGWLERPLLQALLRLLTGDLTRLGLPAPDHRIFETHPILNGAILERLAHGDLVVRPDVERFDESRVVFRDGRAEEYDLVILATGYRRGVPFLGPDVLPDDDVSELFLNMFHDRFPQLMVIGHFTTDAGAFPLLDRQSELVARVLAARRKGSPGAGALARAQRGTRPDFTRGVRYKPVSRMANYVSSRPYERYLGRLIGEICR